MLECSLAGWLDPAAPPVAWELIKIDDTSFSTGGRSVGPELSAVAREEVARKTHRAGR